MAQTFVRNHPYWPEDAPIPRYTPNATPVPILLGCFGVILAILLSTAVLIANKFNKALTLPDRAVFCWFILCGFLHCFFEGYFVLNHAHIAASQDLFAQLWKEYALSDSRYLTSDPFMLSVESATAILWGPLCIATAVCIVKGSFIRHLFQIIVCVAHLYGVTLYYATCYTEQLHRSVSHSRPEFLYFWVYYVGFNLPWAVVPIILLHDSWKTMEQMQRTSAAFEKLSGTLELAKLHAVLDEDKKEV